MGSDDKETSVLYKAIADFTSLSRAVRQAKADLAELKAEEAALNAASVKGSAQQASARTSATKEVEKEVDAFENAAAAATKHDKAAGKAASSTAKLGKETKDLARETDNVAKAGERGAAALGKTANESDRAAAAVRKVKNETGDMERGFHNAVTGAEKLSNAIKKISEPKSSGIINGPWIALIPLFASLLALVNPLVAGISAVGVAALGFASNLGSLAGAALGAIPALSALLSVAGAIKVAFSGVGGAFSAYAASQKASGGGGGGGGPQAEQLSQTEQITRANVKYRESIQNVTWAQQDLTKAKQAYFKQVQDLQKAVDREAVSEARASANVLLAKENYANVMADPGSTKGQKLDAKTSVSEAQQAQQDNLAQEKQDRKDLAQLKKEGVNGDRQVIEAQRAVTAAIWAQQDALMKLHDAQNGVGMGGSGGAAAKAADLYAAALAKLSPSARSTVLQLIAMKGAWDTLHKTVQEAFFSRFVDDIGRLKTLFGPVTTLLSSAARIAGDFVDKLLIHITGKSFIDDLGTITKNNVPILKHFSDGLFSIFKILQDLAVVAGPFTAILTGKMADGLKNLSDIIHSARNDGSLAAWLDKVNTRLSLWWHIMSNIVLTLWNYGAAASGLGDSLTKSLSKITDGWLDSSKKARKDGSPFQQYLKDVRPAITEISKLFGAFFGWWRKTSEDPATIKAFTEIFRVIRTGLGPALAGLLKTLTKSGIGTDLAQAISAVAKAIDSVLSHGGIAALKAFWQAIGFLAQALEKIASIPGVGQLVGALGVALMALTVMRFTGILQLITWLLKLSEKKGLVGIFDSIGRAGKGAGAAAGEGAAAAEGGAAAKYAAGTRRGPGGASANAAGGTRAEMIAAEKAAAKRKSRRTGSKKNAGSPAREPGGERTAAVARRRAAAGPLTRRGSLDAEKSIAGRIGRAGERVALTAGAGGSAIGRVGMGALKGAARGLTRGGIPGLVAGVAGGAILDGVVRDGKGGARDLGADVGGAALTGAGIGGAVGSVIPGIGTAIGAGAGAVVGAGISLAQAKPEQYKKTGDDIGKLWNGVIKSWSDGWKQISGWWNKEIIKPFAKGIDNIVKWWNTDIVKPFAKGIDNIVKWWNNNVIKPLAKVAKNVIDAWNYDVVRPLKAIGAMIGRLWDDYVVKPAQQVMKNVGDWWHDHVVVPAQRVMKNVGDWWHNSVVKPAQTIMKNIGDWWHNSVVKPAQTIMHNIGAWWHDHVVVPAQTIMRNIGAWWHDHVVVPAQTIMRNIGSWWHDRVVVPAQTIMKNIGDGWHDHVVKPLSDFANTVGDVWQRWVVDPISNVTSAIGTFIYNVTHFDLGRFVSNAVTNWANSVDPPHNSGGMIYRSRGGGVPGMGNGDTVRARLTPGEFVLRKGIADRIGLDNLQMLNSGVLSFAQMLRNSAQGQQFAGNFGAGLVPHLPSVSAPVAASLSHGVAGAGHAGFHVENLNVHNPTPERASDSLPRTIRKMTYLRPKR